MAMGKYGKDDPSRFIGDALSGGSGPSEGISTTSIGKGQTINRAVGLDNVGECYTPHIDGGKLGKFGGGQDNLGHSVNGATANVKDPT